MTEFLDAFKNFLLFLNKSDGDTFIHGDMNIDILKQCYETEQYLKLLYAYDFQVQNSKPTRVTPSSITCIDHI